MHTVESFFSVYLWIETIPIKKLIHFAAAADGSLMSNDPKEF